MSYTSPIARQRIVVLGDVMLDRYWSGATERISPEAPVPVVHVRNSEDKPGGAANVAMNLAALGMQVNLLGLIGDDEAGTTLESALQHAQVNSQLVCNSNAPTITKLRVMSRHQQLIRLDNEQKFDGSNAAQLLDLSYSMLANTALLVISDYAKGTLEGVLPEVIRRARELNVPVLVDPKGNNFELYRGATLLTPNRAELEAVTGRCEDETQREKKAKEMVEQLSLKALLLTRSEQGLSLYRRDEPPLHIPAHVREVFDVTGAGDTIIAVLAAFMANGYDFATSASAANVAAGLAVGKLGAASVGLGELDRAINAQADNPVQKISSDVSNLKLRIAELKNSGQRIVFTNGCFDILHAGHVRYLREASALGDQLVVAVNCDASVARLKGESRPLNPLAARMEVLAALSCVDWVVPFVDDTPENLITELLPDVLVKGGDYNAESIVGYDVVTKAGGEVRTLAFVDGYSTSELIRKINLLVVEN